MTQQNAIIGLIVLIVLILGGWYFLTHPAPTVMTDASGTSTTTDSGTADVQNAHSVAAVETLATQGGNFTCSMNSIQSNSNTTGTVYASKQNVRFDLQVSQNGSRVGTHSIRSGGYIYTWVDGQTTGAKVAASASSSIIPQPEGGVVEVNLDTNSTLDCHPWIPDQSQFTPPSDIVFTAR